MFSWLAMASFNHVSGVMRPVSIFVIWDSVQPARCASSSCVKPKRRLASRIAWPFWFFVFIIFVVGPSRHANGLYYVETVHEDRGMK